MAVACASRFACLKLEDDDVPDALNKKPTTVPNNKLTGKAKPNVKAAPTDSKAKSKKKKKATEIAELQSLAFGNNNPKQKHKLPGLARGAVGTEKQWEEWKMKDSEFVSEVYEQDLQEALLLSKIDYEEKKDVYDALKKENEQNKLNQKKKKKNNQKKEKGIMSLDEFQSLDPNQLDSGTFQKGIADLDDFELPIKPVPTDEADFFHKIEEDAEKIITREHRQENIKAIDPQLESARLLQYQEDVRKKDEEIDQLREHVKKLKDELKNVKSRNKKLYGILETGEMREKAEILVQIEQLISVKDELTDQLSEYHTALEQERSKVHALQTELKKCQNSKKQRTESK